MDPVAELEHRLAAAISMDDERELGLAMADLIGRACSGDPKAAVVLGERYMSGAGEFAQDPRKAVSLLRWASEAGEVRAMPPLVILLAREAATQADLEEAAKWERVGRALSSGSVEMEIASQALHIAALGRDLVAGNQAAAVWLQKRKLGVRSEDASIDCRTW